jgi:type II secretion system protein N
MKNAMNSSLRVVRGGWMLYPLLCFGLALWWTFPTDLLLRRLIVTAEQEWGLRIDYGAGEWRWRDGWVLRDLSVESSLPSMGPVSIARFTLRPSLSGVFRRSPLPLAFSADMFEGTVTGVIQQTAEGIDARFMVRQLALEQWPLPLPWERGQIVGSLTANGEMRGDFARLSTLHGTMTANLTEGGLQAGRINGVRVPALRTVQAHLRATLAGERVEVGELRLHADGVEVHVEGHVMLRKPLRHSRLALQLTSRVSGSPPPALTTLVSLLRVSPTGVGERRGSISGSLAAPALR